MCSSFKDSYGVPPPVADMYPENLYHKISFTLQKTLIESLLWLRTSSSRVKMQRKAKKTPAAPRKCLQMNFVNITLIRGNDKQTSIIPYFFLIGTENCDWYQISCPSKKSRNWQGWFISLQKNILNHFVNNLLFKKYPIKAILLTIFCDFFFTTYHKPKTSPWDGGSRFCWLFFLKIKTWFIPHILVA